MAKLPKEIKLTKHAQQRLAERKNSDVYYNTKNLMRSSCKWYGKGDLIPNTALYLHCLYVCRNSKQIGYMTDGRIEVVYDKGTGGAITVMEVKEKFLPITQYIKPSYLKEIEIKKEKKKMKRKIEKIAGICTDCGKETEIFVKGTYEGLCDKCKMRKTNAKSRGRVYIPYKDLDEKSKKKFDKMSNIRAHKEEEEIEIPTPKMPIVENYYQMKAENNPAIAHIVETPTVAKKPEGFNPLNDQDSFIRVLKECGCTISDDSLKSILNILINTDKLKDIFMTITETENQGAMLDLENILNSAEKKLQYNWEYNGFQETDDIKFKGFLVWRRLLKSAIPLWKQLYNSGALSGIKKAWTVYNENMTVTTNNNENTNVQKKYQITTDSISTIFNTRRPFTRVFYATSKDEAYNMFVKWLAERQLHEDKSKTTIIELSQEGIDGRKEKE